MFIGGQLALFWCLLQFIHCKCVCGADCLLWCIEQKAQEATNSDSWKHLCHYSYKKSCWISVRAVYNFSLPIHNTFLSSTQKLFQNLTQHLISRFRTWAERRKEKTNIFLSKTNIPFERRSREMPQLSFPLPGIGLIPQSITTAPGFI